MCWTFRGRGEEERDKCIERMGKLELPGSSVYAGRRKRVLRGDLSSVPFRSTSGARGEGVSLRARISRFPSVILAFSDPREREREGERKTRLIVCMPVGLFYPDLREEDHCVGVRDGLFLVLLLHLLFLSSIISQRIN